MADDKDEFRARWMNLENALHVELDKRLLYLTAGALALSISFTKEVLGNTAARSSGWLASSWALLVLSLLMALANTYFGTFAYASMRKQDDDGKQHPKTKWTRVLHVLNGLSVGLAIAGISCLAMFAFRNLEKTHVEGQASSTTAAGAAGPPPVDPNSGKPGAQVTGSAAAAGAAAP